MYQKSHGTSKMLLKFDKHEIVIRLTLGAYFVYIDDLFVFSCDTWRECRQEIERWLDENGQR